MEHQAFLNDLAEILEADPLELSGSYALTDSNWTSLAFISAIALIDEHYSKIVSGEKLANCKTISDLTTLIEAS